MRINLNITYVLSITLVIFLVIDLTFQLILKKHERMVTVQLHERARVPFPLVKRIQLSI
ncbi:MAG TPA: hypothetical protein VL122_07710 [Nitrospirota bacterium]|nr:hypothetical protein [Nitrospirota bacterium]